MGQLETPLPGHTGRQFRVEGDLPHGTLYDVSLHRLPKPGSAPLFPLFPEPDDNPVVFDFPPKEIVLGVRFGNVAKAYPFSRMGDDRAVINDRISDENVLVVYDAAARMALPFRRDVGNRTLTFTKAPSSDRRFTFMLKDRETGTTWNLLGRALAGELRGSQLYQIPAHNAFWFAWAPSGRTPGSTRPDHRTQNTWHDGSARMDNWPFPQIRHR